MGPITVGHFNRETALGLLHFADVLFPDYDKVQLKQCSQKARGREKKNRGEKQSLFAPCLGHETRAYSNARYFGAQSGEKQRGKRCSSFFCS
jgi:hypothetical protein